GRAAGTRVAGDPRWADDSAHAGAGGSDRDDRLAAERGQRVRDGADDRGGWRDRDALTPAAPSPAPLNSWTGAGTFRPRQALSCGLRLRFGMTRIHHAALIQANL